MDGVSSGRKQYDFIECSYRKIKLDKELFFGYIKTIVFYVELSEKPS